MTAAHSHTIVTGSIPKRRPSVRKIMRCLRTARPLSIRVVLDGDGSYTTTTRLAIHSIELSVYGPFVIKGTELSSDHPFEIKIGDNYTISIG